MLMHRGFREVDIRQIICRTCSPLQMRLMGKGNNPLSLCLYHNSGLLQSEHEFVNKLLTIRRNSHFFAPDFQKKMNNALILLDRNFTLLYNDKVSGKVKGRE